MSNSIGKSSENFHFVYHDDIDLFTVTDYKKFNTPFLMYGSDGNGGTSIKFRKHLLSESNIEMGYFLYGYCACQKEIPFDKIFPNG